MPAEMRRTPADSEGSSTYFGPLVGGPTVSSFAGADVRVRRGRY